MSFALSESAIAAFEEESLLEGLEGDFELDVVEEEYLVPGSADVAPVRAKFRTDSASNASGQGLDVKNVLSGFKAVGSIIGTGTEAVNFWTNSLRNTESQDNADAEVVRKRRAVGLVLDRENRRALLLQRLIPQYYSAGNIKRLIKRSTLPFGWSVAMAINQGFANDIDSVSRLQTNNFNVSQSLKDISSGFTAAQAKEEERAMQRRRDAVTTVKFYDELLF